jgi:hypothetical protein
MTPILDDGAVFGEGREHPGIEHVLAEATIEALEIRVLIRLAGFDEGEMNAVPFTPGAKRFGEELRAIVGVRLPRGLFRRARQTVCRDVCYYQADALSCSRSSAVRLLSSVRTTNPIAETSCTPIV